MICTRVYVVSASGDEVKADDDDDKDDRVYDVDVGTPVQQGQTRPIRVGSREMRQYTRPEDISGSPRVVDGAGRHDDGATPTVEERIIPLEIDDHFRLYGKEPWDVHYGEKCTECNSRIDEYGFCSCGSQGD